MRIKTLNSIKNFKGQRFLVRVDFNVPIKRGKIIDDFRIAQGLETINFLLSKGAKVILMAHLGRPIEGVFRVEDSVALIAERLSELLKLKVPVIRNFRTLESGTKLAKMKEGEVVMLENIRFEIGEEAASSKLARELATLADYFVNDAFAVSHRDNASVSTIQKYLPSVAGLLLEKELTNLSLVLNPKKPLMLIIGGVKIETKLPLIKNFQGKAEKILIGGAIANAFLKVAGFEIGKSKVDASTCVIAKKILAKQKNLLLPVDVIVSAKSDGTAICVKRVGQVSKSDYIFDIGPDTIKLFARFIKQAQTIIWNGPMGFFEVKSFKHGTMGVAMSVAARSKGKAFGVIGGGETIEALNLTGMTESVDWVSTGGGAMLSYLGGEKMPGLRKII